MKTYIFAIMVMSVVMSACSGYDDEFDILPPEPTQPTTNNNDTDKNDDTWEETKDDWFEMPNVNVIESYKKTNVKTYHVTVPFAATLGQDLYYKVNEKGAARPAFTSLQNITEATPSYGAWYANEEGDSIREKVTSQNYTTNRYSRSLTITSGEATRSLNGKSGEPFVMPIIVTNTYGLSADSTKVERNDSLFMRYNITDSVVINFVDKDAPRSDLKPMTVKAKTVIDFYLGEKENNETMPNPDITVDKEIVSISDRTASPVYAGNTITWYEVSLDKTSDKVYVIVNGKKQDVWNNSELASVEWCNSAMYDTTTGRWIPCHLAMDPDQSGWSYTFQLANGNAAKLDAPMNAALISSLKSFKKDNDAKQTPFLTQGVQKRTYSDGDFYTVPGIYTYTVAHK